MVRLWCDCVPALRCDRAEDIRQSDSRGLTTVRVVPREGCLFYLVVRVRAAERDCDPVEYRPDGAEKPDNHEASIARSLED